MQAKTRGMSATNMKKQLIERNQKTDEVKMIMSGKGFNRKAAYTSRPDVQKTEVQHQVLVWDKDTKHDY